MCHIVVDSGLSSCVHAGSAETPLEPNNGQLKSMFTVLLLKDVAIISFCFYFLCARSPLVCLLSCRRTTREPQWKVWSCDCWRIQYLSSQKSPETSERGLYFNGSASKTPAVRFLSYTHCQNIINTSCKALFFSSTCTLVFPSMVGHHSTGTRPSLHICSA